MYDVFNISTNENFLSFNLDIYAYSIYCQDISIYGTFYAENFNANNIYWRQGYSALDNDGIYIDGRIKFNGGYLSSRYNESDFILDDDQIGFEYGTGDFCIRHTTGKVRIDATELSVPTGSISAKSMTLTDEDTGEKYIIKVKSGALKLYKVTETEE